jgi:hypothetical protein
MSEAKVTIVRKSYTVHVDGRITNHPIVETRFMPIAAANTFKMMYPDAVKLIEYINVSLEPSRKGPTKHYNYGYKTPYAAIAARPATRPTPASPTNAFDLGAMINDELSKL